MTILIVGRNATGTFVLLALTNLPSHQLVDQIDKGPELLHPMRARPHLLQIRNAQDVCHHRTVSHT